MPLTGLLHHTCMEPLLFLMKELYRACKRCRRPGAHLRHSCSNFIHAGPDEGEILSHCCIHVLEMTATLRACTLEPWQPDTQQRRTHSNWPATSAALSCECSLAHLPIAPLAARGGADASIIRRHLAALAPNWRLGTDNARALPACVRPNATYADFLSNETFYIG